MSTRNIVLACAAFAAAIAALWWAFSPRPAMVEVAQVVQGRFEQTIDEDGRTRVRERYIVSAPLSGRVQRIGYRAGDLVARGEVVAVMSPAAPPLLDTRAEREIEERVGAAQASLARASAALEQARTTLAQSRLDAGRTQKLEASGFVAPAMLERDLLKATLSAREVEAAEFERHAAEHQLAVARAALTRSREGWGTRRGERLEIRAPAAGRILRVVQESEAVLAMGATLLEIGDPSDLEVIVDVLSGDAQQVAPGQAVKLERQGGGSAALSGVVRRLEPSAFTKISALGVEEQRVNVVIDITSPKAQWSTLGDAYRVDARIVVHAVDGAVKVPVAALFRDGGRWAVFVADGGVARRRIIETTRRGAREALVDQGLAPGEQVIVYPGDAVRDGGSIRVREGKPG